MKEINKKLKRSSRSSFILWFIVLVDNTLFFIAFNSAVPYTNRTFGLIGLCDRGVLLELFLISLQLLIWGYVVFSRKNKFYNSLENEGITKEIFFRDYDFARKMKNQAIGEKYLFSYFESKKPRVIELDKIICLFVKTEINQVGSEVYEVAFVYEDGRMDGITVSGKKEAFDVIEQIKLSHPYILNENAKELYEIYRKDFSLLLKMYNEAKNAATK